MWGLAEPAALAESAARSCGVRMGGQGSAIGSLQQGRARPVRSGARGLAELTRGDEELAGDGQVDATSRSQRRGRFRERLIRRATHYFAAVSDASRSARKRALRAMENGFDPLQ